MHLRVRNDKLDVGLRDQRKGIRIAQGFDRQVDVELRPMQVVLGRTFDCEDLLHIGVDPHGLGLPS
jgi:hypothetical protein